MMDGQMRQRLDALEIAGRQHFAGIARVRATRAAWSAVAPVMVMVCLLMIAVVLAWSVAPEMLVAVPLLVSAAVFAGVFFHSLAGLRIDRRAALGLFDRRLGLTDRITATDEFISAPARDGFQAAAIAEAAPWIDRALATPLAPGEEPRPAARRWPFLLAAVLALGLALLLQVWRVPGIAPAGGQSPSGGWRQVMASFRPVPSEPVPFGKRRDADRGVAPAARSRDGGGVRGGPARNDAGRGGDPSDGAAAGAGGGAAAMPGGAAGGEPGSGTAGDHAQSGGAAGGSPGAQGAGRTGAAGSMDTTGAGGADAPTSDARDAGAGAERQGGGSASVGAGSSPVRPGRPPDSPADGTQPPSRSAPKPGQSGPQQMQGDGSSDGNGRTGGRAGSDALKRSRGTMTLMLAVPMDDHFIGTANPGPASSVTRSAVVQPVAAGRVAAGDRGAAQGDVGRIARLPDSVHEEAVVHAFFRRNDQR